MKPFILTLFIIASFSCTKNAREQESFVSDKVTQELSAKVSSQETLKESVEVQCLGECDNSNDGCGLRWNLRNGTVDCTCTGCTMHITTPSQMQHLSKLLGIVGKSFEKLTKEQYGLEEIPKIKKFHLQYDEKNNTDLLTIEFENLKLPGTYESVLYATKYNSLANIEKTIEIDCKGTCDCRERWVIATGSAECTCTGDCKMTVTEIES